MNSEDMMTEQIVPTQKQEQVNGRLILMLICVIGAISLVALILAALSLSQKGTTNFNIGTSSGYADGGNDDKVWTFAIGHGGSNLEYLDETTWTIRGFHVDIVNAVCEIAQKNCRLVWDIYENCFNSKAGERARGGVGLMAGWYDACTGWYNTYDRALTVDFTTAFRKPLKAAFFTKPNNPDGFQWTDLSGKKIGFFDGWAQDEHCIARMTDKISGQFPAKDKAVVRPVIFEKRRLEASRDVRDMGVPLQASQIIHYTSVDAATTAVKNGDVAAVFANTNLYLNRPDPLQKASDELSCVKGGGSMMMRKDTPLAAWWNPAFSRLKETKYRAICERVDSEHGALAGSGGDVICVD